MTTITTRDIHTHRTRLDQLTDEILSKSAAALEKIEENIRLTHSLRLSSSLITQMDSRIDLLTHNLHQYQHYLSQLNSLLIRSEFFESQLNILEAEQQVNSMRTRKGLPRLNKNWKDDDLNWRTTESTLENLFLEFRFITRRIDQLSSQDALFSRTQFVPRHSHTSSQSSTITTECLPSHHVSTPLRSFDDTPTKNYITATPQPSLDEIEIKLKPIRCSVSSRESASRRTSLNLSLNLLAKNAVSTPPHKTHTYLPTPDTTLDMSMVSESSRVTDKGQVLEAEVDEEPLLVEKKEVKRDRLDEPMLLQGRSGEVRRHVRCKSSPFKFDLFHAIDTSKAVDVPDTNKKFNLRHFISHDTGLKTKTLESDEEEGIKDSEFLQSPASTGFEDYLKKYKQEEQQKKDSQQQSSPLPPPSQLPINRPAANELSIALDHTTSCVEAATQTSPASSLQNSPPQAPSTADDVPDFRSALPTFEHKLNRSNSCDSIFSVMTTRVPIQPGKDSRAQTLLWMQKFSKPQRPSVGNASTVSTVSAVKQHQPLTQTTTSSRQALSNLVTQPSKREPSSNPFTSWFSSSKKVDTYQEQPSAPTAKSDQLTPPFASALMASLLRQKAPGHTKTHQLSSVTEEVKPSRQPVQSSEQYQSFSPKPDTDETRSWPRLVGSFTPKKLMTSSSMVVSETGHKVLAPMSGTGAWNIPTHERIKGSFSTLTIGPHGSKIVQHGESSSMTQNMVITSRVSHAALREALTNELIFDQV